MEYRTLGQTGLEVSELCMGTMQFGWTADEATSHDVLSAAWEAGINLLDTADVYSKWVPGNPGGVAEQIIGRWMKARRIPRDRIVIATKARGRMWPGPDGEGLSRAHLVRAVEESLRRLQTDVIDLYQAHWPDEATPIEETLRAFDELVQQGKVRFVGGSNYTAAQLSEALRVGKAFGLARYECLQPHYSLVHREEYERELEALGRQEGLGVIPYSPLARGFLTGKYRRDDPALPEHIRRHASEKNWAVLDRLETLGRARGKSVSQMALGWLLTRPGITSPIVGPRNLEQLEDNLGAVGLRLDDEEMKVIETASAWDK